MSYDMILFDPALVPHDEAGFNEWSQTLFTRDEDPSFTPGERSQRIQTLYDDIRAVFPDAEASDDSARADAEERGVAPAQYFLDFDHLEVTVSDSDAQAASQWIQDYAAKNGLGIYDVDATGKMTLPDEDSQPPMSKGAASAGR